MTKNSSPLRTVTQLAQFSFFIPAYQRGYRWTGDEVRELLDDIASFLPETIPDSEEETFYCLQPLVVRHIDDGEHSGKYEVIDGQQRLTTIYLICRYINEMWRGKKKDEIFEISYASRGNTKSFLESLELDEDDLVDINKTNIDFFHISTAYKIIREWAIDRGPDFNQDRFIGVVRHNVKVLWYEPEGEDSISIFTRLNIGKIPLTSADLIKALFLKSSNFIDSKDRINPAEKIRLRQLEISGEWDRMEAAFQNPAFWYFLNRTEMDIPVRIEFLFGLIAGVAHDERDPYKIFRKYAEPFGSKSTPDFILHKWDEAKRHFQMLAEWFEDRDCYHKIGYLIECQAVPIQELSRKGAHMSKSAFQTFLDEKIAGSLPSSLHDVTYGAPSTRRVLLLHNVQTMLASSESHSRFPFDRYKSQKWDVEHIQPVIELPPVSDRHQRDWLREALHFLGEEHVELQEQINTFLNEKSNSRSEEFITLHGEVIAAFSDRGKAEANDDLCNLALLDSKTNRGYGNEVFPVKRNWLIKRECEGVFVPICTKNALMKYYTKEVEHFTFWSQADQDAYAKSIEDTLESYLQLKKTNK